ncbi:MAG: tetratricopeptide repeat protein [Granulosicoccaceae bacterium]
MNCTLQTLRRIGLATLISTTLISCSGGGGGGAPAGTGVAGSYLYVSVPTFYFGTQDVGTRSTQEIQITNRGGDIYPINSLKIIGDNSDEFETDHVDEIVLNPSEAIKIRLTFAPVTDGRKFADLDIDFDTIVQVSDAANQNEQVFYAAQALEDDGHYVESRAKYKEYLAADPVTVNKQRAAIKEPVLNESTLYGEADGIGFDLYLSALNARQTGDTQNAMRDIDALLATSPESYFADDALYLKGYSQLMDTDEYPQSVATMKRLRKQYPDTTYYDTALYAEAMAHQEMGNRQLAVSIYEDLRYKHTGVDILGITMAKDNILSRAWFERASNALASMDAG